MSPAMTTGHLLLILPLFDDPLKSYTFPAWLFIRPGLDLPCHCSLQPFWLGISASASPARTNSSSVTLPRKPPSPKENDRGPMCACMMTWQQENEVYHHSLSETHETPLRHSYEHACRVTLDRQARLQPAEQIIARQPIC
jgi:hypothetical protein